MLNSIIETPKLHPIDPEMVLFGSIHIEWETIEDVEEYLLFRDYEPIENVDGWVAYAIIEKGKTDFDDTNFNNNSTYFYALAAKNGSVQSNISNVERVKVNIPPHLNVLENNVEEGAYYESKRQNDFDKKIWELARLQLIFENTFPKRDLNYLKIKVKSIHKDLPEFNGLFIEPTNHEIQSRAQEIFNQKPDNMNLDWRLSEKKLIMKKIEELLEFTKEIR